MYRQHGSWADAGDSIGTLIPGLFGIRPYVVYSGSMEPEIPTGAVVFTKEGEFSPKKGDIITFHNGDTVVTHRVVKKRKGYLYHKR